MEATDDADPECTPEPLKTQVDEEAQEDEEEAMEEDHAKADTADEQMEESKAQVEEEAHEENDAVPSKNIPPVAESSDQSEVPQSAIELPEVEQDDSATAKEMSPTQEEEQAEPEPPLAAPKPSSVEPLVHSPTPEDSPASVFVVNEIETTAPSGIAETGAPSSAAGPVDEPPAGMPARDPAEEAAGRAVPPDAKKARKERRSPPPTPADYLKRKAKLRERKEAWEREKDELEPWEKEGRKPTHWEKQLKEMKKFILPFRSRKETRDAQQDEPEPKERKYKVLQPEELCDEGEGLPYRKSKNIDDLHQFLVAEWDITIKGKDLGDGWVEILLPRHDEIVYLPMEFKGVPVLKLKASHAEKDKAKEMERPQEAQTPSTRAAARAAAAREAAARAAAEKEAAAKAKAARGRGSGRGVGRGRGRRKRKQAESMPRSKAEARDRLGTSGHRRRQEEESSDPEQDDLEDEEGSASQRGRSTSMVQSKRERHHRDPHPPKRSRRGRSPSRQRAGTPGPRHQQGRRVDPSASRVRHSVPTHRGSKRRREPSMDSMRALARKPAPIAGRGRAASMKAVVHAVETGSLLDVVKSVTAITRVHGMSSLPNDLLLHLMSRPQRDRNSQTSANICEYLVDSLGLDVDVQDDSGQTPIFHAVMKDFGLLTTSLLGFRADVGHLDNKSETPMFMAARGGSIDCAKVLLEHRANPNAQNTKGTTPLFVAVKEGYEEVAKLLLDNGADVRDADTKGRTALFSASTVESAEVLIEAGADVDAVDVYGQTALFSACRQGKEGLATYLLEQKANVNREDSNNQTALHFATHNNHLHLCRLLIEARADPFHRDHHGVSPKDLAVDRHYKPSKEMSALYNQVVRDTLGRRAASSTPMRGSVSRTPRRETPFPSVEPRDRRRGNDARVPPSPVHPSAANEWKKLFTNLLDEYIKTPNPTSQRSIELTLALGDVNTICYPEERTALGEAAFRGSIECCRFLLELKADVTRTDQHGCTPLFHAATGDGNIEICRLLVSKKADVNHVDKKGCTPLFNAASAGLASICQYLIAQDCNPNIMDKTDSTALVSAVLAGHQAIAEMLYEDTEVAVGPNVSNDTLTLVGNKADALGMNSLSQYLLRMKDERDEDVQNAAANGGRQRSASSRRSASRAAASEASRRGRAPSMASSTKGSVSASTLKAKAVSSLDGVWNKATIEGDQMVLKSGQLVKLTARTDSTVTMTWKGNEYTGELERDGKLHWSDGDVWTRVAVDERAILEARHPDDSEWYIADHVAQGYGRSLHSEKEDLAIYNSQLKALRSDDADEDDKKLAQQFEMQNYAKKKRLR